MTTQKNATKHFKERWAERIIGITDEKTMREYVTSNQNIITEHANTSFEYATFLFKGQIGDNLTRNYHIKDDMVFVTNTTDDAFITIYKVDLGFTDAINTQVRKGLIEEIKRLEAEKEDIELKVLFELENKQHQAEHLDAAIELAELQLVNMKRERDFVKEEVKHMKSKSLNTGLELKKYVLMLVNSKEYKKDLTNMK